MTYDREGHGSTPPGSGRCFRPTSRALFLIFPKNPLSARSRRYGYQQICRFCYVILVSLNFVSWNQIAGWLRRLAGLPDAACTPVTAGPVCR